MKSTFACAFFLVFPFLLKAQLTIDQIMADPKISVGALPSAPYWSEDGKTIYFNWNPELKRADSLYAYNLSGGKPVMVQPETRKTLPAANGVYNKGRDKKLYVKNGDLFLLNIPTMQSTMLTNTVNAEEDPFFSADESQVFFSTGGNLYSIQLAGDALTQWTNFTDESENEPSRKSSQETWLKEQQLGLFKVIRERADKKEEEQRNGKNARPRRPKPIYLENKRIDDLKMSPDGRFITYRLSNNPKSNRRTIVPSYVTESGFTEDIQGRTKVGSVQTSQTFWILDVQRDTAVQLSLSGLDGLNDQPEYLKEYAAAADTAKPRKPESRKVYFDDFLWSENGTYAVLVVRSLDNKDRWIAQLDLAGASLKTLERQRDEAWIGGPVNALGFLDDHTLYYQSEADGYAHLYRMDLSTGVKSQLTKGRFEVQKVQISADKRFFYLTTNEIHPGEQQLYRMPVDGGERVRLTQKSGAYQAVVSPDDTRIAYLFSTATQPWELFVQENEPDAKPVQITFSQSEQFKSYAWRQPEIVKIKARDGVEVYARLFHGKGRKGHKPAVIFVHGAGYLQNAHRWWSIYFRENMFHNFLADQGYTVLDMDYRGSAGYGRDWRTGIYRYMGGKDLTDNVDGAAWLVRNEGVDPKKIGLYGGSYGGFITLMAMFTTPDVFQSGAALRPVTDWAAYNHGYTSNILNEPQTDSIAYQRSSPINFAEGLKGHLLICHGMVDVNVHFQDVVRLSQRLIELRKENWEVAAYPVEDHGFLEPTSWADEYKRIFKLFEQTLR